MLSSTGTVVQVSAVLPAQGYLGSTCGMGQVARIVTIVTLVPAARVRLNHSWSFYAWFYSQPGGKATCLCFLCSIRKSLPIANLILSVSSVRECKKLSWSTPATSLGTNRSGLAQEKERFIQLWISYESRIATFPKVNKINERWIVVQQPHNPHSGPRTLWHTL